MGFKRVLSAILALVIFTGVLQVDFVRTVNEAFKGWYENATFTVQRDNDKNGNNAWLNADNTDDEDIMPVASAAYTLSFVTNGGTPNGEFPTKTVQETGGQFIEEESIPKLTSPAPQYYFGGWYIGVENAEDHSNYLLKKFDFSLSVEENYSKAGIPSVPNNTVQLYAYWATELFTVEFYTDIKGDGGNLIWSTSDVPAGAKLQQEIYKLKDAEGNDITDTEGNVITRTGYYIYAKFIDINNSGKPIIYDTREIIKNMFENDPSAHDYIDKQTGHILQPQKTNYAFVEWLADTENGDYTGVNIMSDTVFFATYLPLAEKRYIFTFHYLLSNGSALFESQTKIETEFASYSYDVLNGTDVPANVFDSYQYENIVSAPNGEGNSTVWWDTAGGLEGTSYHGTIASYSPSTKKFTVTLNSENLQKLIDHGACVKGVGEIYQIDFYFTLNLKGGTVKYKIKYMLEDIPASGATESTYTQIGETQTHSINDIHVNLQEQGFYEKEFEGYTLDPDMYVNSVKELEITNQEENEFEIKYNRNRYFIYYNTTGGHYLDPAQRFYGENLNLTTPVRDGFVFAGWDVYYNKLVSGGSERVYLEVNESTKMPAYDLHADAKWNPQSTPVNFAISYFLENADDDGFTNVGTYNLSATAGSTVTFTTSGNSIMQDVIDHLADVTSDQDSYHFNFNVDKTLEENDGNYNFVIEGDGSTVIPVYFNRNRYTVTFDLTGSRVITLPDDFERTYEGGKDSYTVTDNPDITHTDADKANYYIINAKYNANIAKYWPIGVVSNYGGWSYEDHSNDPNSTLVSGAITLGPQFIRINDTEEIVKGSVFSAQYGDPKTVTYTVNNPTYTREYSGTDSQSFLGSSNYHPSVTFDFTVNNDNGGSYDFATTHTLNNNQGNSNTTKQEEFTVSQNINGVSVNATLVVSYTIETGEWESDFFSQSRTTKYIVNSAVLKEITLSKNGVALDPVAGKNNQFTTIENALIDPGVTIKYNEYANLYIDGEGTRGITMTSAGSNTGNYTIKYFLEAFPDDPGQTSTSRPADNGFFTHGDGEYYDYNNVLYKVEPSFTRTGVSNSLSPKEIEGFSAIDTKLSSNNLGQTNTYGYRYNRDRYTLTFHNVYNGDSASVTMMYGQRISSYPASATATELTNINNLKSQYMTPAGTANWTFDGWYDNANFDGSEFFIDQERATQMGKELSDMTMPNASIAFYAKFKAPVYTVNLYFNGGVPDDIAREAFEEHGFSVTDTTAHIQLEEGEAVNFDLGEGEIERLGYTLVYWYEGADSTKQYVFGESVKIYRNLEITAKWGQHPENNYYVYYVTKTEPKADDGVTVHGTMNVDGETLYMLTEPKYVTNMPYNEPLTIAAVEIEGYLVDHRVQTVVLTQLGFGKNPASGVDEERTDYFFFYYERLTGTVEYNVYYVLYPEDIGGTEPYGHNSIEMYPDAVQLAEKVTRTFNSANNQGISPIVTEYGKSIGGYTFAFTGKETMTLSANKDQNNIYFYYNSTDRKIKYKVQYYVMEEDGTYPTKDGSENIYTVEFTGEDTESLGKYLYAQEFTTNYRDYLDNPTDIAAIDKLMRGHTFDITKSDTFIIVLENEDEEVTNILKVFVKNATYKVNFHAGNGVTEWEFNNEFKLPTDKDGSEIYTQYTDAGGNVYYTASVTYPQALAAPASIPTAKNKLFKQWCEEADSSVAFTGFDKKDYIVSNLDLYATWLDYPVVTFNYSDNLGTDYGWTDNDDEYYTVGTDYTATAFVEVTGTGLNPSYGKVKRPSDPYKKVGNVKYALDYWAYNGAEFDFNTAVSGNITLTAVYSTPVYSFDFACFSFKEGIAEERSTDPVVGAEFTLKAVGMQDRVISKATVDNNYLMFNNSTGYYSIDFLLPDKEYTLTQTNASVDGFDNLAGEITFRLDENGSIKNASYSGSETNLIDFEKTDNNVITTYNKVWKYYLTIEFQYLFYGVQQGEIRTITTSELEAAGFGPYYYGDYFDNEDVVKMDELFTPTGEPYDKCEHIAWDPGDVYNFTGSDRTPTVRIIKSTPPQDKPFTGVAGITLDPSKMSIENITVPVKGSMSFYISSNDITAETEVSLNGFSLPVQTTINAKVFNGESARYYYLIAGGEISSFKLGDLIRAGSTNEKYVPETGDAAVAFVVDLADTDGAVLAPAATEYSVSTKTSGVDHNIYINFIKPDVVGADKASANTTDVITFSGIKIPSGLFENTSSVALYAVMYDDQGKIFNLPAGFYMYASVGEDSALYVNRTVVKLGTMQTVADTSIDVEILLASLGLLEGMYTIKLFVATIGANSIGTVEYLVADSGLVSVNERDIYRVKSNTNVYSMGGQAEIEITLDLSSNAPAMSDSLRATVYKLTVDASGAYVWEVVTYAYGSSSITFTLNSAGSYKVELYNGNETTPCGSYNFAVVA